MPAQRTNTRILMQRHAAGKLGAAAPSHQAAPSGGFGGMTSYYTQHFAPAPAAASPPPPPAPPPPPVAPGGSGGANGPAPFFSPDDLLAQANFYSQWQQTFAGLDQQLAQMQIDTAYQRQQLKQQDIQNKDNINNDAAARGIFQSSIHDGNTAQEVANYTRADQNAQDKLNSFDQYVQGQKNDYATNVLPAFQAKEASDAVGNAQAIGPTPDNPTAPTPSNPPAAAPAAPAYKPVVKNGKFYHYYAASGGQPERYVYIRPASGA